MHITAQREFKGGGFTHAQKSREVSYREHVIVGGNQNFLCRLTWYIWWPLQPLRISHTEVRPASMPGKHPNETSLYIHLWSMSPTMKCQLLCVDGLIINLLYKTSYIQTEVARRIRIDKLHIAYAHMGQTCSGNLYTTLW